MEPNMDLRSRLAKKRREAERLRDLTPAATLEMGFSLCDFAREFARAAQDTKY